MPRITLYVLCVLLLIIALEIAWLLWRKKKGRAEGKLERNRLYRFSCFQKAYDKDERSLYLQELATECAALLFPTVQVSRAYPVSSQDKERICIEYSRRIADLEHVTFQPPATPISSKKPLQPIEEAPKLSAYPLLYLIENHLSKTLHAEGKRFLINFLARHQAAAYQRFIFHRPRTRDELEMIYPDSFFARISSFEELSSYPEASHLLVTLYLDDKTGSGADKLLQKIMNSGNSQIYEMILEQLPQVENKHLARLYHEGFFQRITSYQQLLGYPHALAYLISNYLDKKAGPAARACLMKILQEKPQEIQQAMYNKLFQGDTKEFALKMIQDYEHIPTALKISLLSFQKQDHYVQASIEKLQESEETIDQEPWKPLFTSISKVLGSEIKIPQNAQDVRKIKKLLEFHRDNANSAGNMIKVLDIEKILESIEMMEQS